MFSSFDTRKGLFAHVVTEHVPRDSLIMSCMWEGCAPVRRSRSSLLFHLQVSCLTKFSFITNINSVSSEVVYDPKRRVLVKREY